MSTGQEFTTKRLIIRSLLPSGMSFLLCGLVGFFFVVSNIILQSVTVGTSLPGILDGQWSIYYTQHVVQPLTTFLANNAFNKLLVAVLWGLAGFAVYVGFEYAVHGSKSLQDSKHDVQMARGQIVEAPLKDEFWGIVRWRLYVLGGGILFLIIMQPLLHHATSVAPTFVVSTNLASDSIQAFIAVLEWMIFLHGFVVFLRLYTQRTRIFGDDRLY